MEGRQRWLRYWVVYWSLGLAEQLLVLVTWLLPAYSLLRAAFLLWCMAPLRTNGADYVTSYWTTLPDHFLTDVENRGVEDGEEIDDIGTWDSQR